MGRNYCRRFFGGRRLSTNPYLIKTGAELAYLAQQTNAGTDFTGKYFKQVNGIDLNSAEWTPIGKDETNSFKGNFNGNGMAVTSMKITSGGGFTNNIYIGLFGCVDGGSLSNISVSGAITPNQLEVGQKNISAGSLAI